MEQIAVRTWGNSLGIRIPKKILNQLNIQASDVLQMEIENGAIIIKKQFRHKSFEERLADYNGEITVSEFDWGEPVGKELL
jgi:antitoxin MazE